MWQTILGIIATLGLSALLARQLLGTMARKKAEPLELFAEVGEVLDGVHLGTSGTAGVHKLWGRYQGLPVQVQTVADTLATRKLPSLWLMVTIPEPLPVAATLDLMMRPAGPTSFSNYDHLPHALPGSPGLPETAIVRTDDPQRVLPMSVVIPHLALFDGRRAKELLISPKGIRLVWLLAEGDRARYGVFRQAAFGEVKVEAADLRVILDTLTEIRKDVVAWHRTAA